MPTVLVCTDVFLPLARAISAQRGLRSLAVVTVPHPTGGVPPEALDEVLAAAVDDVAAGLTAASPVPPEVLAVSVQDAPEDVLDFLELAERRGWSDGLPLVPPSQERVAAAVAASGRPAGELVGLVPPAHRGATVASVAANAVMAGCRPEVVPVVLAAVEAVLRPEFNLQALTTTTHPVTPLVVVHGPVVERLGFNSGPNVFGQGNRANAAVGRALRLVLQNVGQALPGVTDRATHGTPGKYSSCIAVASDPPLTSFHAVRGGDEHGAVTVVGGEGPHNVNDHGSTDAAGLLTTLAGALANLGSNNVYLRGQVLLVLGPEHAELLERDGYDLERLQAAVHEHPRARVSTAGVSAGNLSRYRLTAPHVFEAVAADATVPMLDAPDRLLVLVAGGPGKHSMIVPTFGTTTAVTVPVRSAPA